MTNEITPPPELVQQWFPGATAMPVDQWVTDVATQAANWGADQELKACCEWLADPEEGAALHKYRRPKPPTLKEQALETLRSMQIELCLIDGINTNAERMSKYDTIRRALEQLDD